MDGQPIDLAREYGRKPARAWRHGDTGTWREITVRLGQLANGRWYVSTTERAVVPNGWAWPSRARAEEHVAELLAEHVGWVDVPAWYDGQEPHGELGPWRREGRGWVLDA